MLQPATWKCVCVCTHAHACMLDRERGRRRKQKTVGKLASVSHEPQDHKGENVAATIWETEQSASCSGMVITNSESSSTHQVKKEKKEFQTRQQQEQRKTRELQCPKDVCMNIYIWVCARVCTYILTYSEI